MAARKRQKTVEHLNPVDDIQQPAGFIAMRPGEILAELATLPIQRWRYSDKVASIQKVIG
jgi:hypothetical protein